MAQISYEQRCRVWQRLFNERDRQVFEMVQLFNRLAIHSGQQRHLTAAEWKQASAQVDAWTVEAERLVTEMPLVEDVLNVAVERGIITKQSTASLTAAELTNRVFELTEENSRLRNQIEDQMDEEDALNEELRRVFPAARVGIGHGCVPTVDLVRSLVDHVLSEHMARRGNKKPAWWRTIFSKWVTV